MSGSKLLLEYVDYGPFRDWVDSSQVELLIIRFDLLQVTANRYIFKARELPQSCMDIPPLGMKLRICVKSREDDTDLTTAMMQECLLNIG